MNQTGLEWRRFLIWFSMYTFSKLYVLVVLSSSCICMKLNSDQVCCMVDMSCTHVNANHQLSMTRSDFLSFCHCKLVSLWTPRYWDACPWVWLCILCVCVWWPLLWQLRTHISHMPHSWPWKRELWDCPGFMTNTHAHSCSLCEDVLCEWLLIYLSISWKEETLCDKQIHYASEMPQMFTSLQNIRCLDPSSK